MDRWLSPTLVTVVFSSQKRPPLVIQYAIEYRLPSATSTFIVHCALHDLDLCRRSVRVERKWLNAREKHKRRHFTFDSLPWHQSSVLYFFLRFFSALFFSILLYYSSLTLHNSRLQPPLSPYIPTTSHPPHPASSVTPLSIPLLI